MTAPEPLFVDGRCPAALPAYPLPFNARDKHPLFLLERSVYLKTAYGWERIGRGYVTDFASDPVAVTMATALLIQPLGPWALGSLGHDMGYAIGQPGYRPMYDHIFRDQMKADGVDAIRRTLMYDAVRLGGQGGYDKAKDWWNTENFGDPESGRYPLRAPVSRESCFFGGAWGVRDRPDWDEDAWEGLLRAARLEPSPSPSR